MNDPRTHPAAAKVPGGHEVPRHPAGHHAAVRPEIGDPRREALIASLRARYAVADQRQDAEAKRGLFKEAAYLGISPEAYQG